MNNKHRQKWALVNPLSAVPFVRERETSSLPPSRFFSTLARLIPSSSLCSSSRCCVSFAGEKKIWRRRRCVRLHRSLNANFNKRGKLRENCDGAKHFLQGSCFFFFFSLFLLRHRSGVINETSNASRDSNVFQFASNFRRSHWPALILILRSTIL